MWKCSTQRSLEFSSKFMSLITLLLSASILVILLNPVNSSTKPQYVPEQFPIQFQFQQYGGDGDAAAVAENEDYYSLPSSDNEKDNVEELIKSFANAYRPKPNDNSPKLWYDDEDEESGSSKNEIKVLVKKEVGNNGALHVPTHQTENIQAVPVEKNESIFTQSPFYLGLIIGSSVFGTIVLIGAGLCYWRISRRIHSTAKVDYKPSNNKKNLGKKSKSKFPTSDLGYIDSKLASSAHMYHYQSQKEKMKPNARGLIPSVPNGKQNDTIDTSGDNSENDENSEDYTIYECPGLARPGADMVVRNPLFNEPTVTVPNANDNANSIAQNDVTVNNHNDSINSENELKDSNVNGQN